MTRSFESQTAQPRNWAEWLLDLGKNVNKQIRSGAGIEEASERLKCTVDSCKLSLVFFLATDVVKLRAMVEDWSRERLVEELGGLESAKVQKQQAGTA